MTRSMSKSIFIRHDRGVWEALQCHRAALLQSNEQLARRSAEVADLTSRCEGLKEVGAADREEARRLKANVLRLKAEADHHDEVSWRAQEGLQALTEERDSLSKSLEDQRSSGQALSARIEGVLLSSCFLFLGSALCLSRVLTPSSTL
jgi:predicted RNase H-like nuclease (RuvC/YqgF family)